MYGALHPGVRSGMPAVQGHGRVFFFVVVFVFLLVSFIVSVIVLVFGGLVLHI